MPTRGTLPDVAESINSGAVKSKFQHTPELPERWIALWPVVVAGTGLWALAFLVLLVLKLINGSGSDVWLWTCVAGVGLGFIGLGIMTWQRAAFRRGSKSAQRGA
ncbi:DUF2530 domain-containing protein [Amycolatopsis sp. 195334CR]|nr:DUF2530 domain-containing protein [Amycolatopsis sp. 195334CR]